MARKKKGKNKSKSKTVPLPTRPAAAAPPAPTPAEPMDKEALADGVQDRQLEIHRGNIDLVMIELLATVNKNLCVLQSQLSKLIDHLVHKKD